MIQCQNEQKIPQPSPSEDLAAQKAPLRRLRPLAPTDVSEADREKFWSKVQIKTQDECWIWKGLFNGPWPYGVMRLNGSNHMAHRISYAISNGGLVGGLLVCHSCDTPACVNPEHLFLGTYKDNSDDMRTKGRAIYYKKHMSKEQNSRFMKKYAARGKNHSSITSPETIAKGIVHGMHKLIDSEVMEIRRRFDSGEMQSVMANQYRVSRQTINNVVHRKNWKHL